MSRAIKVEDQVYQELERLRADRQTFSDVVSNLLRARLRVLEMMDVIEGQVKFREWQKEKLQELQGAAPH